MNLDWSRLRGFVRRLTENVRFVSDSSTAYVIYGKLFGAWIMGIILHVMTALNMDFSIFRDLTQCSLAQIGKKFNNRISPFFRVEK
jgi:hypothetical protein